MHTHDHPPVCGNEHEVWFNPEGTERAMATCDRGTGHLDPHEGWVGVTPHMRRIRWRNLAAEQPMTPDAIDALEAQAAALPEPDAEQAATLAIAWVLRNVVCGHPLIVGTDPAPMRGVLAQLKGPGWVLAQGATMREVHLIAGGVRCARCVVRSGM